MKEVIKKSFGGLLAIPLIALSLSVAGAAVLPQDSYAECEISLTGGRDCVNTDDTPDELTGDEGIFTTIVNVLLFIVGAIAVIMLIIGGIRYTTSNGDSNQVTAAKNTILYAIIGIIVAIIAYAVVNFVITTFAGE